MVTSGGMLNAQECVRAEVVRTASWARDVADAHLATGAEDMHTFRLAGFYMILVTLPYIPVWNYCAPYLLIVRSIRILTASLRPFHFLPFLFLLLSEKIQSENTSPLCVIPGYLSLLLTPWNRRVRLGVRQEWRSQNSSEVISKDLIAK